MSRTRVIYLLLLTGLLVFTGGCAKLSLTPNQQLEATLLEKYPEASNLTTSKVFLTPEGEIIVFSYVIPGTTSLNEYRLGVASVAKTREFPPSWEIAIKSQYARITDPALEDLVHFGYSTAETYSAAYGRVYSDAVAGVSGIQGDEAEIRENRYGEFVVIYSLTGQYFCRLRILGAEAVMLKEVSLSDSRCPQR